MNQRVAVGLIERLGAAATTVGNGLEALDAVQRFPFDVVLMDCQMPEMDGFEATAELRRREPTGVHLPIIAMTASAMKGDRERCLAAGMDDYVSKPVRFEELEAALQRWVPRLTVSEPAGTIDHAAIAVLRAVQRPGQPYLLPDLIAEFEVTAQEQIAQLHQAVNQSDASTLFTAAHRLKGDAALLGAMEVRKLCAELETLGRDPSPAWRLEAMGLLGQLEQEFARTLPALQQYGMQTDGPS